MAKTKIDKLTKRWIRNAADEKAAENGCFFDLRKASFFVWWVERYCKLYEGKYGGKPAILNSIAAQPDWEVPKRWDWDDKRTRQIYESRCEWHLDLMDAGEFMDWPYDAHMRIYGWQKFSEHHQRMVRRFRRAYVWASKKQKKSPSIAFNALYQICADGEAGNHVFIFSSDGGNAREIAGNHILAMVDQSPELASQTKIWQNTMKVMHNKSRSYLMPAASNDKRSQTSKHGYNGSIFVDEFHTVDKLLDTIVRGAGISREQPLHMCFSTAGLEVTSFGNKVFKLCEDIQEGRSEVEDIFAAVYSAPQDLTPAQFAKDPMKYGRMANPSMGHTVDPAEFLSEYETVKGDPVDLAEFFVLRLNVWQQLFNPAFNMRKWKENKRKFSWEDFLGHKCWCGFDRSINDDLTAMAFLFEWEDKLYALVDAWLPQWKAERENNRCPYITYAKEGWLRLVDSPTIRDGQLLEDIEIRNQQFDIHSINYDPNRCSLLMDKIAAPTTDVEPGLGIEVDIFRQTAREYHQIYEAIRAMITEGDLYHPNNQLLNINMENCRVTSDKFDFKRLCKPADKWRKMDLAAALTMAVRGYLQSQGQQEAPPGEAYENADVWSDHLVI